MSILPAVVTLLTALVALDLVLTFAVIRRLAASAGTAEDDALPAPGTPVGPFRFPTVDGGWLTDSDLGPGPGHVLVLSPSCAPCRDLARELSAGDHPQLAGSLAVVVGEPDDPAATGLAAELAGPPDRRLRVGFGSVETIERAFGVTGYPAVLRIADGSVEGSGHRPADVGSGAPARA